MKRIFLLFSLAVILFLVFSYIDEYENLVAPYFRKGMGNYADLFKEEGVKGRIKDFLLSFNSKLSEAYLSSDPVKVSELPLSEDLKKSISEEIVFLRNRGLILDVAIKDLDILEIKKLSSVATIANAMEKTVVRYLNYNREHIFSEVEIENKVNYTLIAGPDGLVVAAFEVVPVEKKKKDN